MKKLLLLSGIICGMLCFSGCGNGVDENKTPEQIKQEAANLDAAAIEAKIEAYKKTIEEKSAQLKAEVDKLAEIPVTEQLGEEAKKIRGNIDGIKDSLEKLGKNLDAYVDSLKAKK